MQGGPALKGSEGYRSVLKQNIREMLNGKGIGGRETSRMLQGMDHLGLVQAQHKWHLQTASKAVAGISPTARGANRQCCPCLCTRQTCPEKFLY